MVAAHHYGNRGKKIQVERSLPDCGPVWETRRLSRHLWGKKETEKDAHDEKAKNMLLTVKVDQTYDWRIKKRSRNMRWVICKTLFIVEYSLFAKDNSYDNDWYDTNKIIINKQHFFQVFICLFLSVAINIILWTWYRDVLLGVFDIVTSLKYNRVFLLVHNNFTPNNLWAGHFCKKNSNRVMHDRLTGHYPANYMAFN